MAKRQQEKEPVPKTGKTPAEQAPARLTMTASHEPAFYTVGMGGSAGGLEAFGQFFAHLPPNTGMAFVLVSHLDPTHKALLAELLQHSTQMKVTEAEDGMVVRPNAVYVIPPNTDLSIKNGRLHLLEPSAPRGLRMPIDFFFRQLAADQHDKAIAIVLSGMGSDGTLGIKAIKENSGLVLVQDPASAKFAAMPESARNSGRVDVMASAEELPVRLLQFLARAPVPVPVSTVVDDESNTALPNVFTLLRLQTGNDFSNYKPTTILRRIERRMNVHQLDSQAAYVRYLRDHPQEVDLLYKELLIGVTSFFRDRGLFDYLGQTAIPALLSSRADDRPLRVWVPACSTGEEAYSIAITIKESLARSNLARQPKVQIFATDIDSDSISKARQGLFSASIAADVSPQRLERYFVRDGDGYRVGKEIRELVVFAPQNLLGDPPFTKLEIVCCRNFFIYVNSEMQQKLLSLMHYSLIPRGLLILGSAESIGNLGHLFAPLDKKWKVFQRQETARRPILEMSPLHVPREPSPVPPAEKSLPTSTDIPYAAQRALLDFYAPPSVVVNSEGDIVYVNGRTGRYLEPSSGKVNINIFAMARDGLREELVPAFRKAKKDKATVVVSGIQVNCNGSHISVNLTIQPFVEPANLLGTYLLIFEEQAPTPEQNQARKKKATTKRSTASATELEDRLRATQELLQATMEEKEANQEELRSLNEELQSNNEELQSTNEELTTSKEELQSLNEEMQSVNAELRDKLDEQSQTNNDMANLLNGIEIATIFLDSHLCVKRFTPKATRIVNFIAGDLGRPLHDLVTKLKYNRLVEDARQVLETLIPQEAQLQDLDGHWYQIRVLPYRTTDNKIDGVVCTFTEITTLKQAEAELQAARALAENVIATIREPLLILDANLRVVSASRSFYSIFQQNRTATEGRLIFDLGDRQWDIPELRKLLETILPENTTFDDFWVEHDFPRLGPRVLLLNARRVLGNDNQSGLILLAIEDVTKPT
ncbi:Chemotaxis protein methyltransferase [Anatilimnocola aggregata]|uniref:Chemotaxis protein methyltransferase n=1 Tax=Anatilimnocola aggregata TaxID=2528021 RepID=A0A517Y804_9BACT|nr:chemotaxis protein CheB [Anatilimnocola aggregata]QDU26368.1 Chemotaxis protein methyltransferase [Anatilimnocola aggregata]